MKCLIVPVSSVAALVGNHDFKNPHDTLKELRDSKPYHPIYDHVKRLLYRCDFYKKFCEAPEITHRLRVQARIMVDKASARAGLRFNKPYSYFVKARGLYLEGQNTNRAEKIFNTKIVDRQKKFEKTYDRFKLRGAIDGQDDQYVYEIKTRATRREIAPWEKQQLMVYCHLARKPGRLIAFLGEQHSMWEVDLDTADRVFEQAMAAINRLICSPSQKCMIVLPEINEARQTDQQIKSN